jgi:methyl-accepting chemotaxis protein-1 (serine sensor receptor)
MQLRLKLPLAFVAAVLIALSSGLAGIYQLHAELERSGHDVQRSFAHERAVGYLAVEFKNQRLEWRNMLLRGADPALRARHWQAMQASEREITEKTAALLPELTGKPRELMERFAAGHADLRRRFIEAYAVYAEQGAEAADRQMTASRVVLDDMLTGCIVALTEESNAITRQAADNARHTVLVASLLMAAVAAATIAAALMLSRGILRPVRRALAVAQAIAGGDLTSRFGAQPADELGQLLSALQRMNASLAGIVGEVRGGTRHIAAAAGEIGAGSADLSVRTETQAGTLEETASAMEQLTATVQLNAEHAHQASALSRAASDVAQQGGAAVAQVVDTMMSIHAASARIADIIGVIDGIAFQTNILALNAAVEAARAGEQGRGFAVVAGEVRTLAQRSAEAARQIRAVITDATRTTEAGEELAARAGRTMENVVASVGRVSNIVEEIAHASAQQSSGLAQINQAVLQMDGATQQNAALVQQTAAASGALEQQAAQLARTVDIFKLESGRLAAAHP